MSLDKKMKMALVDISLMHILKRRDVPHIEITNATHPVPKLTRQSDKRTAKKVLELCNNINPDLPPLTEKDPVYQDLLVLVSEGTYLEIRQWLLEYIPPSQC